MFYERVFKFARSMFIDLNIILSHHIIAKYPNLMFARLFLAALLITATLSLGKNLKRAHQSDDWEKLDIENLSDVEKSIDDFIRDSIGSLDGELAGAARNGDLYRYAYIVDDKENWDVQVLNDGDNNQLEVATRTQNWTDKDNENLLYSKKTSIIKKAFADIVGAV
jgi:hypothetical protein